MISTAYADWDELPRSSTPDTYQVVKGDTLWDLSQKFFGNAFYWPKLWEKNREQVSNPHLIYPGQNLNFTSGSSENLPRLSDRKDPNHIPEYEKVDQSLWKPINPAKQFIDKYDQFGMEKDLRIKIPTRFSTRVPTLMNDNTLPYLGEISTSTREGEKLGQGDTVMIRAENHDLQVGSRYSILSEPEFIKDKRSDRSGYSYQLAAELRILGIKDGQFLALIEKSYDTVQRESRVYPLPPMIQDIRPVPAPKSVEALILMNTVSGAWHSGQFRYIHLDRGLEDGVQVGNIFRIYQYYDPHTKEKITDNDYIIHSDVLVVHVSGQFSTGYVLNSKDVLTKGDFGVLLTDVSDIRLSKEDISHLSRDASNPEEKELDELDALDSRANDTMGIQEQNEINELNKWDAAKEGAEPDLTPIEDKALDYTGENSKKESTTGASEKQPPSPISPSPVQMDEELPSTEAVESASPVPDTSGVTGAVESPDLKEEPASPQYYVPGQESAPTVPVTNSVETKTSAIESAPKAPATATSKPSDDYEVLTPTD